MQSSAELEQALGVEPNYVAYGQGTEVAGAVAAGPLISVGSGTERIRNAEGIGDVLLGSGEIALGVLPVGLAVRSEVALLRAERSAARAMQQGKPAVVVESPSASVALEAPGSTVQSRIDELRAAIPENSRGRITMSAAVVEDSAGQRSVLIGTSEPRGYLRPGVELRRGERVVAGTGHAEADIVSHATANELKVVSIGATRPVCQGCQQAIHPTTAEIVTPLKMPKKPKP
jgi:filamentous hemagglutinin